MSVNNNITRGGLSGKMSGFTPEPPESVWKGISGRLGGANPRRKLFFLLAAAAGLALALSVGIPVILGDIQERGSEEVATLQDARENGGQANREDQADAVENMRVISENEGNEAETVVEGESQPALTERKFRSKLEEKVVFALQESEQELAQGSSAEDEEEEYIIAELNNYQDEPGEGTIENIGEGDEVKDKESITDEISDNQKINAETEINEDSLLQLLEPEIIIEEKEAKKNKKGKWQIGASLSPQFSYRDAASNDALQNMKVNSSESGKLTYAGGLKINYAPSKRLSLESGLYYNKMGVNIGDYRNFTNGRFASLDYAPEASLNNVVSISNSMGTVIAEDKAMFVSNYTSTEAIADYHLLQPDELVVNESMVDGFTQTFEFLEIPFNLKYLLIDRSLKVQLIGGMSTNFLVANTFKAATPGGLEEIGEVGDVNWINYSGNAGIGFAYDIMKNFSFNVEPRFRYYLNSINTSELPVTRPYTFGLRTGVSYTF